MSLFTSKLLEYEDWKEIIANKNTFTIGGFCKQEIDYIRHGNENIKKDAKEELQDELQEEPEEIEENVGTYDRFMDYVHARLKLMLFSGSIEYSSLVPEVHDSFTNLQYTEGRLEHRKKNVWWNAALSKNPSANNLPQLKKPTAKDKQTVYDAFIPMYKAIKDSFDNRSGLQFIFNHAEYTAERDALRAIKNIMMGLTGDSAENIDAAANAFAAEIEAHEKSMSENPLLAGTCEWQERIKSMETFTIDEGFKSNSLTDKYDRFTGYLQEWTEVMLFGKPDPNAFAAGGIFEESAFEGLRTNVLHNFSEPFQDSAYQCYGLDFTAKSLPADWFKTAIDIANGKADPSRLPSIKPYDNSYELADEELIGNIKQIVDLPMSEAIKTPTVKKNIPSAELPINRQDKEIIYNTFMPIYKALKESFDNRSGLQFIFNHAQYVAERDSIKALTGLMMALTGETKETVKAAYTAYNAKVNSFGNKKSEPIDEKAMAEFVNSLKKSKTEDSKDNIINADKKDNIIDADDKNNIILQGLLEEEEMKKNNNEKELFKIDEKDVSIGGESFLDDDKQEFIEGNDLLSSKNNII